MRIGDRFIFKAQVILHSDVRIGSAGPAQYGLAKDIAYYG